MFEYLRPEERERLEALCATDPFAYAVVAQGARIITSKTFDRVQSRAKSFLMWVLAKRLLGEADEVKETTIAIAVFNEPADFDSSETAKIRVAAADLRHRLLHYAAHEGADDPLTISIPTSTYVPVVVDHLPTVEVIAFDNWSTCDKDVHLRNAFLAELSGRLNDAHVRVSSIATDTFGCERRQYLLHGSFLCSKETLYINISLSDPQTGRAIFTESYKDDRDSILKMTRVVSDGIVTALEHSALLA